MYFLKIKYSSILNNKISYEPDLKYHHSHEIDNTQKQQ